MVSGLERPFNRLPPHPTCDPELSFIHSTNSTTAHGEHWAMAINKPGSRPSGLPAQWGWGEAGRKLTCHRAQEEVGL